MLALLRAFWHGRILVWILKWARWVFTLRVLRDLFGYLFTMATTFAVWLWPPAGQAITKFLSDFIAAPFPVAVNLTAETLEAIAGIQVDRAELADFANRPPGRSSTIAIGDTFLPLVSTIFDVNAARDDFSTRSGFAGSTANLSAFFGMNLTFQLRSLLIGTLASLTGWGSLRHLEGLHQTINWAFGFGWLSWAVMSEYMNVTVNPGLRRLLNSQVLPNDFSESEAFAAFLAGRLELSTFSQILDNFGMRGDIRETLIDLRESDLSESNMKDLRERGELTESQIFEFFRLRGYREQRARWKTDLVVTDRQWRLEERLTDLLARQFRDCALDESTYRLRLSTLGYTGIEEDLAVQVAIQERFQRRFLSMSQNFKALDAGLKSEVDIREELACQGFTPVDIDVLMSLDRGAVARRPRITTFSVAPGRIKAGDQVEVRWVVDGAADGGVEILPAPGPVDAVGSYVTTIDATTTFEIRATNDVGTTSRKDAVLVTSGQADGRLPSASLSVRPGTIEVGLLGTEVEIRWRTTGADTVSILPELGTVPAVGSRVVRLNATTTFRLVATNANGDTVRENTVLAELPDIDLPDLENSPRISTFSIRPATIDSGDAVEIRWQTADADKVTIEPGIGEVGPFGTLFPNVSATTTFTLRAENEQGEIVRQRSVIVRPLAEAAEPTPPPMPRLSFSIRPGTADPNQEVVLEWNAINADSVSVEGIPGRNAPQGGFFTSYPTSRVISATARGPGGEVTKTAAVIIRPPAPPAEPDAPRPPTATLRIRPGTADPGEQVAIEWETTNADTVDISPVFGQVGEQGSQVTQFLSTVTIELTATGPGGTAKEIRTLLVRPPADTQPLPAERPPTASLSVRPGTIDAGDEVEISWRTENADSVTISPVLGNVPPVGTSIQSISSNTILTLTATGPGGEVVRTDAVLIRPPSPAAEPPEPRRPTARINVRPGTAEPGDQLELSWVVENATRVFIDQLGREVEQVGTEILIATETTTFTISAEGPGGFVERQDTVLVKIPPPEGGP